MTSTNRHHFDCCCNVIIPTVYNCETRMDTFDDYDAMNDLDTHDMDTHHVDTPHVVTPQVDTHDMEESQTNESEMSLSEWQIVSSEEDNACHKEEDPEEAKEKHSSDKHEGEDVPQGSSVEDVLETLEGPPPYVAYDSSSSSSDIDIIDESSLDYNPNNISIPSIELSLSSSFETDLSASQSALPARESTPEPVADIVVQRDLFQRVPPYVIFGIGCLLAFILPLQEGPVDRIMEMEKRIMTLQEENRGLKDQVVSKIEDDKLFVSLEEQIKALKGENSKLSRFMQDLIHQLEEKTIIFKEESEIKGKGSYQNEIDKLKEQVNILQIDNDELQKQLVRMRYGIYSPRAQDPQSPDASLKEETSDDTSESENSTELLSEEIKELRKKLYSEVEKLKSWKESVQHLMKGMENRPKEFDKKQEDKDKAFKKNKENQHEGSFKDANGDPNQVPQLNITDLVFRYIGVDKKKVKDVFESVGHYFKKAQEKTKDIFDENVKNDMWNFIGGLRKQWHMMKKAYFPKHAKKAQGDDYKPRFTERYPETPESGHKKDSAFQPKHGERSRQETEHEKGRRTGRDNQHFDTRDEFKKQPSGRVEENSKWKAYQENLAEATASLDSWLFERAAHRSELREKEEEVNWYLKNRKEADDPEFDHLKPDEPTADPYENIDLFAMD